MPESDQMARKPFVGMRGTSIPTGGGWENLPMTERLRQTFERGVTRAELDLADAYQKKIQPGHIPEAQKRISKQIAAEFGANFSVHAPYQVDPSSQSWAQRTEAAEIMRQSVKYANEMGAKIVTFHPTANLSGASFFDPFTFQANPVPAHFMVRDKREFDYWCGQHNITENSPIYRKLREEAGIMYGAQAAQYTQHYAAAAPTYAREFGSNGAFNDAVLKLHELRQRGVSDTETIRQNIMAVIVPYVNSTNKDVSEGAGRIWQSLQQQDPQNFIGNLEANWKHAEELFKDPERVAELRVHQGAASPEEYIKSMKLASWQKATMATGGRLNQDGTSVDQNPAYDGQGDEQNDLFWGDKTRYNFAQAMTLRRQIDLGNLDPTATGNWMVNLEDTMRTVLSNPEVKDALKNGVKLSIENLWGVNPEKGVTEAAGYFNKAEHVAEAVRRLRAVARENGLPEESITLTFDTEHAAIGSQTNPTEFIDTLKKRYPDVGIGNVHLVGGGSTAPIFGHKGFGSIEDDIARKHPDLLKKLVEMGAPITMEPGSGGIKDVEAGLETLLLGAPLEAMQAAGFDKNSLPLLGYTAAPEPAYPSMPSYFDGLAAQNSALVSKSLYSFGPSLPQPFRTTYGPYASPTLYQGGLSHQAPGLSLWPSSQPIIYSMKPKE